MGEQLRVRGIGKRGHVTHVIDIRRQIDDNNNRIGTGYLWMMIYVRLEVILLFCVLRLLGCITLRAQVGVYTL